MLLMMTMMMMMVTMMPSTKIYKHVGSHTHVRLTTGLCVHAAQNTKEKHTSEHEGCSKPTWSCAFAEKYINPRESQKPHDYVGFDDVTIVISQETGTVTPPIFP